VTEPKTVSERVDEVVPGIWTWSIADERISDYTSTSYAIATDAGVVLIDPLPLVDDAMRELGEVEAICLTTSNHQRSAWRLRQELGVQVYAPALAKEIEEEPDVRYSEGDVLPGGLRALFTPGAGTTQHSFLLDRDGCIAFVPDILLVTPERAVVLVPAEFAHDVDEARRSSEKLLGEEFELLCVAHGGVVRDDPKAQIRAALDA
jgi:glyoxylase-like metal-dependent hydrolase (beta-lactamase superfamily II)